MDKEIIFFENFVNQFDKNNKKIKHKYDHTYRVVEYAKKIAKSINLNEKEYNRAIICALFHDLGRFPQIKEYDTFIDKISFDHGDKSYEILKNNNYTDEIILNAVKYHNKKYLPNFDEITNLHCKLVRDADKLDILFYFNNKINNKNVIIDDKIINYFKNHELVDNTVIENEVNGRLRELSFIFDINFKKSIEIIINNNLIDSKLNSLRNINNKDKIDLIEKELKKYIQERFDIKC